MFHYYTFLFGTINTHSNLLVNLSGLLYMDCWSISSKICVMAIYLIHRLCMPNLTGPLPIFRNRPSYAHTTKSKLSSINNPHDMHVHNNLSNVAINDMIRRISEPFKILISLDLHRLLRPRTSLLDHTLFPCGGTYRLEIISVPRKGSGITNWSVCSCQGTK